MSPKNTQLNTQFRYSLRKPKPEENEEKSVCNVIRKRPFTLQDWLTIAMLAVANLCSTIAFSGLAPFYPGVAKEKGLSGFETRIIFGVSKSCLLIFCLPPVLGKLMPRIGSRNMFIGGLTITGVSAICFGFLNFLPGRLFFWAWLFVRITEVFGDVAFVTSSLVIAARLFSGNVASIVGMLATFRGLGFTAGPLVGGFLYDVGGFQTPFIVLGSILLLATVLSFYLIGELKEDEAETEEERGIFAMIKIPWVFIMVFAVVISSIPFAFLDLTQIRLRMYSLSPTRVGLMFFLCSAVYTLAPPLLGILIDKFNVSVPMLVSGATLTAISLLLIGPAPFLPITGSLMLGDISLAILGLARVALYIPTFPNCLDAVKENDFEDNTYTYGCVSGIMLSSYALGGYLGPTMGGAIMEWIGFEWTVSVIYLIFIVMIVSYSTYRRCRRRNGRQIIQT